MKASVILCYRDTWVFFLLHEINRKYCVCTVLLFHGDKVVSVAQETVESRIANCPLRLYAGQFADISTLIILGVDKFV
jgi:hypothetical protein